MKIISYDKDTLELFSLLKRRTPKQIISDEYSVAFDYGDFYIAASPEDLEAASPNQFDDAIRVKFVRVDSTVQIGEHDKILFKNTAVDRIWITQTTLYFTEEKIFETEEEALGDFIVSTATDETIADVLRQSTSGHQEIVSHPDGVKADDVDSNLLNLVDAGIILEIDERILICFSMNNFFFSGGRVISLEELKSDILPFYKLIEA